MNRAEVVAALMVERYGDPEALALEAIAPVPARAQPPVEEQIRERQRELWRMSKNEQRRRRAVHLWAEPDGEQGVA